MFVAAKVRDVEQGIGIEYANDRNVVEVKSFGNHLGAYENIRFVVGKPRYDVIVLPPRIGCVKIHTQDGSLREKSADVFLHLLCACTDAGESCLVACWTPLWYVDGMTAVMADENVLSLVIGEGNIAMGASRHPSALLALDEAGKATAILKENNLFSFFKSLTHCLYETRGEWAFHLTPTLGFLDVYDLYGWKLHVTMTLGKLHVGIQPFMGEMVSLKAGGGCAEECLGTEEMGKH